MTAWEDSAWAVPPITQGNSLLSGNWMQQFLSQFSTGITPWKTSPSLFELPPQSTPDPMQSLPDPVIANKLIPSMNAQQAGIYSTPSAPANLLQNGGGIAQSGIYGGGVASGGAYGGFKGLTL